MGRTMTASLQAAASTEPSARCSPLLSCCKSRSKQEIGWYNEDIWTSIMALLDTRSLLRLAVTNRRFCAMAKAESIWKAMFFRDLSLPAVNIVPKFSWRSLYKAALDGSHSYSLRQPETHIDWMRTGAFCVDSGEALATAKLLNLKLSPGRKKVVDPASMTNCAISNVQNGIWIADLHLVRCPVCNLTDCEGTMQTLDARHWELFLHKEYKASEWKFEQVCTHVVHGHCKEAAAGIFDFGRFCSQETQGSLDLKIWVAPANNWQPKVHASRYGAAASTNLQPNHGLHVKFHILRAGTKGPVVGIRVCQQLL